MSLCAHVSLAWPRRTGCSPRSEAGSYSEGLAFQGQVWTCPPNSGVSCTVQGELWPNSWKSTGHPLLRQENTAAGWMECLCIHMKRPRKSSRGRAHRAAAAGGGRGAVPRWFPAPTREASGQQPGQVVPTEDRGKGIGRGSSRRHPLTPFLWVAQKGGWGRPLTLDSDSTAFWAMLLGKGPLIPSCEPQRRTLHPRNVEGTGPCSSRRWPG